MTTENVNVTVAFRGGKWVAWESEYPEEGYVGEWAERPTAKDLKAISTEYIEKK